MCDIGERSSKLLLIFMFEMVFAQGSDDTGTHTMSPLTEGILMGCGLLVGIIVVLTCLICCCCRPEGAINSLTKIRANSVRITTFTNNETPEVSQATLEQPNVQRKIVPQRSVSIEETNASCSDTDLTMTSYTETDSQHTIRQVNDHAELNPED